MKDLESINEKTAFATGSKTGLKRTLFMLGPAIVIAAAVIGPGSVTTLSSMGALYGYEPLWIVVCACFASYFYQEPAIRITCTQGLAVLDVVRLRYSATAAKILFVMLLFGTLIFQAGNFIGAAMAMNFFIPQLSITAWTAIMILMGLAMALASKYELIESFTKVLVLLMVLSFAITAIWSGPSIGDLVSQGFSFKIPGGNWVLVLALLGTTMVPDIPVSLSALYKNKFCQNDENAKIPTDEKIILARTDLRVSMVVTGLISIAILLCSATVLKPQGVLVKSAVDMAQQLTPLLGRYAGILFSLGLWAAAFSSGLFRMQLMPMLFNQAWGYEENLKTIKSRILILLTGFIPLSIVFLYGSAPVQLIITAQAINGMLLPIICFTIWKISKDKNFLMSYANSQSRNIIFSLLFFITLMLALRVFLSIFKII